MSLRASAYSSRARSYSSSVCAYSCCAASLVRSASPLSILSTRLLSASFCARYARSLPSTCAAFARQAARLSGASWPFCCHMAVWLSTSAGVSSPRRVSASTCALTRRIVSTSATPPRSM